MKPRLYIVQNTEEERSKPYISFSFPPELELFSIQRREELAAYCSADYIIEEESNLFPQKKLITLKKNLEIEQIRLEVFDFFIGIIETLELLNSTIQDYDLINRGPWKAEIKTDNSTTPTIIEENLYIKFKNQILKNTREIICR